MYNILCYSDGYDSTDSENDPLHPCLHDDEGNKILNGITITKAGLYAYGIFVFLWNFL